MEAQQGTIQGARRGCCRRSAKPAGRHVHGSGRPVSRQQSRATGGLSPCSVCGQQGAQAAQPGRTVQSSLRVDNRHASAIELQVLHAAPVSRDQKIEVNSRCMPQPASLGFGSVPGTVLWQHNLAAGAIASFAAEHVLRWPKGAQLREWLALRWQVGRNALCLRVARNQAKSASKACWACANSYQN